MTFSCLVIQTPATALVLALIDVPGATIALALPGGFTITALASRAAIAVAVGISAVIAFVMLMLAFAAGSGALSWD